MMYILLYLCLLVGMASEKKGRSYCAWTDEMDKAMLDVFIDHYNKGDRAQNGWKPHVYTAAMKNVREKCDKQITKEHIVSRSKTFDKYYVVVNKMLCQSGFGWDWDNMMISVDSEDVWRNYVKANKEAASYRNKVIQYWDMISVIYSKDRATGAGARTAAFKTDVSEPPPKQTSPEDILAALGAIGLEEDDLLAAYDILVSDDRKFKSLQALPEGLKKK